MNTRRSFLRRSTAFAAGLPLMQHGITGLISSFASPEDTGPQKSIGAFGIQLYMVREDMERDAAGTLKQLRSMGYRQLESFGGNKGMFWGFGHHGFHKLCTDSGLSLVSSHYNDNTAPFEKQAADAAAIGMKYLICPWKGPQTSIDAFKRFSEEFNRNGETCRKHGLRFGYHPHDYPYKKIDGELPIDVLLENTDKNLVNFQMDFYYTVTEGQDPKKYLDRYKDRFRLCHMRDVLKHRFPAGSADESACDLGSPNGSIDYPSLLSTAVGDGMRYFFVEQSYYDHETPLQSAQVNAEYLKKMRLA